MLEFLRNMFAMQRNRNERGASAVEYGLLVAGIAAVIVTVVIAFGGNINDIFNNTCSKVGNGSSTAQTTC